MRIIYTKSYEKTLKNIKKYKQEKELLNEILEYIKRQPTFTKMIRDPLIAIYHFERLKYELNEFYSFRLSKVIRLIVKPKDNDIEIDLVYISKDHYNDFNKGKVICYDE